MALGTRPDRGENCSRVLNASNTAYPRVIDAVSIPRCLSTDTEAPIIRALPAGHVRPAERAPGRRRVRRCGDYVIASPQVLSGIVDNIPYTTAMIPVVRELGAGVGGNGGPGDVLWWALALGACLGGNLTIVAASANVLVANLAERGGQRIRFWEFFRYGSLVTFLSMVVGSVYLWLRYLL